MSKCTSFEIGEYPETDLYRILCRCPKCKGWLPQNFPIGKPFTCKKCGAILETIPDTTDLEEEEKDLTDDEVYESHGGKICLISSQNTSGKRRDEK